MRSELQNNHMTQSTHEGNATSRPLTVESIGARPAAGTVLIVEDEIVVSFFIRTLFEERACRSLQPELPPRHWS